MKKTIICSIVLTTMLLSCTSKQQKMENRMKNFVSSYEAAFIPIYREAGLASWEANITGTDEAWARNEKASISYVNFFTDRSAFAELKELKESGMVRDPILARQLEIMYNQYLSGQVDSALLSEQVKMETEITKKYTTYRAVVNGRELSDNEIEDILRNSLKSSELQAAWEGHKMIGPAVADDIIKLVKHRNTIAQQLGFNNYHKNL
jgi:peptidyl-dipeptidase A